MTLDYEVEIKEFFRKAREIKNPENDLGDSVAETYLIADMRVFIETEVEGEYESGFSAGQDEAEYGFDDRYEEGYDDGYGNAREKYEVSNDEV